nr:MULTISPECIES: hypothetical protein [Nocardia]
MRIRTIKPEFWVSEDIAVFDWDVRLIFVGLWSYVDDNGVGRDNEKLIVADLFPLEDDPRDTLAKVSRGLQKLESAGLIVRYIADGRRFLFITNWGRHQRVDKPNKPRYPLPTSDDVPNRDNVATLSRHPREIPAPGTGEQRNRGKRRERGRASAARPLQSNRYPEASDGQTRHRHPGRLDPHRAGTPAPRRTAPDHRPPRRTREVRGLLAVERRSAQGLVRRLPQLAAQGHRVHAQPPRPASVAVAAPERAHTSGDEVRAREALKDNPNPQVLAAADITMPHNVIGELDVWDSLPAIEAS